MRDMIFPFGKFTHVILCPDTPKDEEQLRQCEGSLRYITVHEIDTIYPGQIFAFLPGPMEHERDSHVLHYYRL